MWIIAQIPLDTISIRYMWRNEIKSNIVGYFFRLVG